jgi:hypothetical protein
MNDLSFPAKARPSFSISSKPISIKAFRLPIWLASPASAYRN